MLTNVCQKQQRRENTVTEARSFRKGAREKGIQLLEQGNMCVIPADIYSQVKTQ